MTTWTELEDLPVETDELDPMRPMYDDDDPTAAPVDTDLNGEPITDDDAPRPIVRPDGTFDEDRGFVDSRSVVRVWIDDEGTITKVRVSPSWRERVAKGKDASAQASGLAAAFQQSFTVINIARREQVTDDGLFDDVPRSNTILSWESLDKVSQELDAVHEQISQVPEDERAGQWRGEPAVGHGAKGKVQVELNLDGGYSHVRFDPEWLDESRVGQICDAVPEAARDARAKYVPGTYEPSEFDELRGRTRDLRNELSAMMKRGFF